MLDFVVSQVVGAGNADSFDYVLLEVGLDTGRLILAAATSDAHSRGHADGCSVRLQSLQDIWYDTVDAAPPDDSFPDIITKHIRDVGATFLKLLPDSLPTLLKASSPDGFTFRLFGRDLGVSILDQHFPRSSGG